MLTCGSTAQKIGDELRRVSARAIAIFFLLIIVRRSAVKVRLLPEYVCQMRRSHGMGTGTGTAPHPPPHHRTQKF